MLISVQTVTFCNEIFASSISVHVKCHPIALATLYSTELFHTLTVQRKLSPATVHRISRIYFNICGLQKDFFSRWEAPSAPNYFRPSQKSQTTLNVRIPIAEVTMIALFALELPLGQGPMPFKWFIKIINFVLNVLISFYTKQFISKIQENLY